MSNPSIATGKFIGTTQECFYDFVVKYPHLPMLQLIADVCVVSTVTEQANRLATVQRWQARAQNFPNGEELLRMRCMLDIAGYEVVEFRRLSGTMRALAFIVGFNLMTPLEATGTLGFSQKSGSSSAGSKLSSLWRLLVHAGSTSAEVIDKAKVLSEQHQQGITTAQQRLREQIAEVIGQIVPAQSQTPQAEQPTTVNADPLVLMALGSSFNLTTSLLHYVLENNVPKAEVLAATRYGQDLYTLRGLIDRLLADVDSTSTPAD